ncbi:indolethylamine N-methyltransferase [Ixodes scapularis]
MGKIVVPRLLDERSEDGRHVVMIDDSLTLRLQKSSVLAERIVISGFDDVTTAPQVIESRELEKYLYEDPDHMASLMMQVEEQGLQLDGMLNPTLKISPLAVTARRRMGSGVLHKVELIERASVNYTHAPGYGYTGEICGALKVAIAGDKAGTYKGVHVAAHEAAHLLGVVHDGAGPPANIPGHPGAQRLGCAWEDGYMMSYVDNGPRYSWFSPCAEEQIRVTLSDVKKRASELVERTRQAIRKVIPCDVLEPGVLPDEHLETFDAVLSCNCLESATRDHASFRRVTCNVAGLVKPGGLLILAGVGGQENYPVGNEVFPMADVNEDVIKKALADAGLNVEVYQTEMYDGPDRDAVGRRFAFVIAARKA